MKSTATVPTETSEESPLPERVLISESWSRLSEQLAKHIVLQDENAIVYYLGKRRTLRHPRILLFDGDASRMDLGLSGKEYKQLCEAITTVHHCSGSHSRIRDRQQLQRIDVEATRNILQFSREGSRVRRFCHWSTILAAGITHGHILETDVIEPKRFATHHEEFRYKAEQMVSRAKHRVSTTVFRCGIVVDDTGSPLPSVSQNDTGLAMDFPGPYLPILLLSTHRLSLRLPLPTSGRMRLHIVPLSYVITAGHLLSMMGQTAGKTYHLTDPYPLSAKAVYEKVAQLAKTTPPRFAWQTGFVGDILAKLRLESFVDSLFPILSVYDRPVTFDTTETTALLAAQKILCPPPEDYLQHAVDYAKKLQRND